jgi:hypothetical protein
MGLNEQDFTAIDALNGSTAAAIEVLRDLSSVGQCDLRPARQVARESLCPEIRHREIGHRCKQIVAWREIGRRIARQLTARDGHSTRVGLPSR